MIGRKDIILASILIGTTSFFCINNSQGQPPTVVLHSISLKRIQLLSSVLYQANKVIIGSYIVIGGSLNAYGAPYNNPLIELHEIPRIFPLIASIPAGMVAWHGLVQLEKIFNKKMRTHHQK